MDIESLEAANQSLQVDLKLAFKRIGDLQAAIEDEMESDDNDDLINRYSRAQINRKQIFLPLCHCDVFLSHKGGHFTAQLEARVS